MRHWPKLLFFALIVFLLIFRVNIPMALVGVYWTLWATDTPLDMMGGVGLVILVGVVVNNEHVNPDLFGLMALQDYAGVQVNNFARTGDTGSAYGQFLEQD